MLTVHIVTMHACMPWLNCQHHGHTVCQSSALDTRPALQSAPALAVERATPWKRLAGSLAGVNTLVLALWRDESKEGGNDSLPLARCWHRAS